MNVQFALNFDVKSEYFADENVVLVCKEGYHFNTASIGGFYAISCEVNGTWTTLPKSVYCQGTIGKVPADIYFSVTFSICFSAVDCGTPPRIAQSTLTLVNGTTLLHAFANYSCDVGFRIEPTHYSFGGSSLLVKCDESKLWKPRPSDFTCECM